MLEFLCLLPRLACAACALLRAFRDRIPSVAFLGGARQPRVLERGPERRFPDVLLSCFVPRWRFVCVFVCRLGVLPATGQERGDVISCSRAAGLVDSVVVFRSVAARSIGVLPTAPRCCRRVWVFLLLPSYGMGIDPGGIS